MYTNLYRYQLRTVQSIILINDFRICHPTTDTFPHLKSRHAINTSRCLPQTLILTENTYHFHHTKLTLCFRWRFFVKTTQDTDLTQKKSKGQGYSIDPKETQRLNTTICVGVTLRPTSNQRSHFPV